MRAAEKDLDEGLFSYLSLQGDLVALTGTRFFPDFAGQDEELPLVVYELEDDGEDITQQGPSGRCKATYTLTVWAGTRKQVMSIGRELKHALHGYRGAWKDIPIAGAIFEGAGRSRDADTGAFCLQMRFTIHYQEI